MKTFTAIDFETAQGYRWSICQIGLVQITEGVVTVRVELLVQPPQNYYWEKFIDIHGISPEETKHAPSFKDVWPMIQSFIAGQNVVAHNGAFDFTCLQQTLEYYGLEVPEYEKHCTYQLYGKSLRKLCDEYSIELNHHNALSDAMACAKLYMLHLNKEVTV